MLLSSIPDHAPFAQFQKQAFHPFLYSVRKAEANPEVPPTEDFAPEYYGTAARNVLKMDAAAEILLALEKCNITAVPLKGLALVISTYSNPGIRPMSDVDLLIDPEARSEAHRVLTGLGYTGGRQYRGSCNYSGREGQINLDLHTRFMRYEELFPLDRHEIKAKLRVAQLSGQVQAKILAPEHQLLHIGLHLAPGLYAQMNLINLLDIYFLIVDRLNPIDWDYLLNFCETSELSTYLFPPLELCRQMLNAPIPEPFLRSIGKRISRRQREYISSDYLARIVDLDRPGRTILLERLSWAPSLRAKFQMLCQLRLWPESRREEAPR
jgi:hypothetical protein